MQPVSSTSVNFNMTRDSGNKFFRKNYRVSPKPSDNEQHNMYHSSQESSAMLNEHRRRNLACYEQKRRSELNRSRFYLQRVPGFLPRQPLSGKIKLSMEVQNSDFASLMGEREAWNVNDSISKIMHDTGCMIQFADQNITDKSILEINQVTITGDFPNVDEAQRRIRNLSPITISISLKHMKAELVGKDLHKCLLKWRLPPGTLTLPTVPMAGGPDGLRIESSSSGGDHSDAPTDQPIHGMGELADFNKIQFFIVYPPRWSTISQGNHVPVLVIRASYCDFEKMIKASNKIYSLLFDKSAKEEFAARLEIPLWQRRWVVGSPDGVLMRAISKISSCTIHFPVSSHGTNATSYFLSGNAKSVILAIRMLHTVGPVRMEFDVENGNLKRPFNSTNEETRNYDQFDTENNVIISMRKSQLEGGFRLYNEEMRHAICLLTSEENLNAIYRVRRKLLNPRVMRSESSPIVISKFERRPKFLEYLSVLIKEASAHSKNSKTVK